MRQISLLILAVLLVGSGGCGGSKPKDLIIGKWESEAKDKKSSYEFKSDGTLAIAANLGGKAIHIRGKYKFLEEEVMEMEVDNPFGDSPKTSTRKAKVKIDKDQLTILDDTGVEEKARRVK